MNRRFKFYLLFVLILGEILVNRYARELRFTVDFLYLILVYISVRSGFITSVLSATALGLVTDFFSANTLGVFGFSRTLAAALINETARRIDLKSNFFLFLLIVLSLSFSNFIAGLFFHYISGFPLQMQMLVYQPLLTGVLGLLIVIPTRNRNNLNLY